MEPQNQNALSLLWQMLRLLADRTVGNILRMLLQISLPKKDRGPLSWGFVATLAVTLVFGLIMLFSASYSSGYNSKYHDIYHYIGPQFTIAVLGFAAMLGISRINYRALRYGKTAFYIVTILLMIIAAFFTKDDTNGTYRWAYVFGISIQPSELAKFSVMLCAADIIDRNRDKSTTFYYGLVEPILPIVPILVLMFFQKHSSGMALMLLILGTVILCSGTGMRWWSVAIPTAGCAAAAYLYYLTQTKKGYESVRLGAAFGLTPSSTAGMGYQTRQGIYAIASGRLFGVGIGNSVQKHQWLPYAENDFIYAIVCEELGYIGAVAVILLFAALILQGIFIALRSPDYFGTLLGIGIISQIAWQVFWHIGVNTALLPNTGIGLPFFSYGGTSLLILLGEMGVLLSISRAGNAREAARRKQERAETEKVLGQRRVYRKPAAGHHA